MISIGVLKCGVRLFAFSIVLTLAGGSLVQSQAPRYGILAVEPLPGYKFSWCMSANSFGDRGGISFNPGESSLAITHWRFDTPNLIDTTDWDLFDVQVNERRALSYMKRLPGTPDLRYGVLQNLVTSETFPVFSHFDSAGNPEGTYHIHALNDHNFFAGSESEPGFVWRATAGYVSDWATGAYGEFNPSSNLFSVFYDINNFGLMVGAQQDPAGGPGLLHSGYWTWDPRMQDYVFVRMPGFFPPEGRALGVNNHNVVVGFSVVSGRPVAMRWDLAIGQSLRLIDSPNPTRAVSINDFGDIVIDEETPTGHIGYLFDGNTSDLYRLQDIIDRPEEWALLSPTSINNIRLITGAGLTAKGTRGFVMAIKFNP